MAATITVRNLDERTQKLLKHRAVDNGRSFEAEIRAILETVANGQRPAQHDGNAEGFFQAAAQFRGIARDSGLVFPERSVEYPREVVL
ncbi:MAG: hypothetical protein FWF36_03325 [Propionibacteriaceae bacterium]|nr:hypothetical protein [Propionibacteriaceae bacterium]